MLSDPHLTGYPEWLSFFLARKIIAPFSAAKSAEKYKKNMEGRRTKNISTTLLYAKACGRSRSKKKGITVEIAMRYGEPDISSAFKELERRCPLLHEVVVFPCTRNLHNQPHRPSKRSLAVFSSNALTPSG